MSQLALNLMPFQIWIKQVKFAGRKPAQHVQHTPTRMGGETSTLNWHNCLWSCSINLSLATGILFCFHMWKIYHLYFFLWVFYCLFVSCFVLFHGGWCLLSDASRRFSEKSFSVTNVLKNGTWLHAAITGICCGHLAWSLHNFRHWAAEEIAFSISFWHFSSWQHVTECCLNPKLNAITGAQLWERKKKRKEQKQGRFNLPCFTTSHRRVKQKYMALGTHSIAACLLKIICNFQETATGTTRPSWPNEKAK